MINLIHYYQWLGVQWNILINGPIFIAHVMGSIPLGYVSLQMLYLITHLTSFLKDGHMVKDFIYIYIYIYTLFFFLFSNYYY